jgi:hypothetical protein
VKIADRDDEVYGIGTEIGGIIDIQRYCPDIRADLGAEPCIRDKFQGLPFAFRCDGRSCLDDVDSDIGQFGSNLKFLFGIQRDSGSLLTIP